MAANKACEICLCMTCQLITNCPVYDGERYKGRIRTYDRQKRLEPWQLVPTRCSQVCIPHKQKFIPLEDEIGCKFYLKDKPIEKTKTRELIYNIKLTPLAENLSNPRDHASYGIRKKIKVGSL